MKCSSCEEQLSAYSDAALGPRLRRRVGDHLRDCLGCRQELADLQLLKRTLAEAKLPEAREEFWDRIYAEVHAKTSSRPRPLGWQLINLPQVRIPALAAIAVLLLTVYWSVGLGRLGRFESLPIHSIVSEHARYSVMQPFTDPGRMNYIQAASDLASLDNPVILVSAH